MQIYPFDTKLKMLQAFQLLSTPGKTIFISPNKNNEFSRNKIDRKLQQTYHEPLIGKPPANAKSLCNIYEHMAHS